jgi:DNA-binding IclR family transcriptional regulator
VPQDAPITRETAGSLMQAVWLTVHRLQPCTNAEVKTALGEPRNTVHRALQDLLKQGRARKEGDHYWVIEAPGARGDE